MITQILKSIGVECTPIYKNQKIYYYVVTKNKPSELELSSVTDYDIYSAVEFDNIPIVILLDSEKNDYEYNQLKSLSLL